MRRLLIVSLFSLSLAFSFVFTNAPAQAALFGGFKEEACKALSEAGQCTDTGSGINKLLKVVLNIFSLIVGVVAVIMVIINGLKFTTSGGDPQRASSARNGIIYAMVGLVVVVLAQVIVRFVLNRASAPICPIGQALNAQGVCAKS